VVTGEINLNVAAPMAAECQWAAKQVLGEQQMPEKSLPQNRMSTRVYKNSTNAGPDQIVGEHQS
jgi:hypothetical protein